MPTLKVTENRMIATSNGLEVTTILVEPDKPTALMVLGHGSGTPTHCSLMVQMAEAFAAQGVATFRYNYPYSERMTTYDPREIDSLEVLLATTRTAKATAESLELDLPLFLGGRSMSSQVVSLALTREDWPDVQRSRAVRLPDAVARPAGGHRQSPSAGAGADVIRTGRLRRRVR